jgi:hypothetical protein
MQKSKLLVFSGFEGFSPVMSGLQEVKTNKRKKGKDPIEAWLLSGTV